MRGFGTYRRGTVAISVIVVSVFLLTRCINDSGDKKAKAADEKKTEDSEFKKFAGSTVCAGCHKDIYEKHLLTEHHLTSAPATEKNILGSFENGKNAFVFDPFTNVTMEKRDSGFYQVEYSNGGEVKKERFDIVFGSGRKGQSYLSWIRNKLAQLPITYFSPAGQWSNSPGYPPHRVVFNRAITSRCLECHSTYFETISDTTHQLEDFDRHKIIYAVDCERCHGPAAMHVEFQSKNPDIKEAKFIVNPGKMSRERLLDLCALCHGGPMTKTKPSFRFQAGDTLSNYFSLNGAVTNPGDIDVHGNQLGLLSLSKCYTIGKITCINCHNIHQNENGKTEIFSQRCTTCHSHGHEKICKMTSQVGPSIIQNCIDCHMPKQMSHAVSVYLEGEDIPTSALMRTHYIKVYPEETQKILNILKKKNSAYRRSPARNEK